MLNNPMEGQETGLTQPGVCGHDATSVEDGGTLERSTKWTAGKLRLSFCSTQFYRPQKPQNMES